jgi:hypothetical protein
MKRFINKAFDASIGKFIRLCQRSLAQRAPIHTVQDLIDQHAIVDSAEYAIKNFDRAMQFENQQDLRRFCLDQIEKLQLSDQRGVIAEFGVWKGESINFFAESCPNARVYGFDSFEGLEEDWYSFRLQKGTFNLNGKLPVVESNVKLLKGWFEDTMPEFIDELQNDQIHLLHMDADTYKPTNFVLNALRNNLRVGTIIIFDEYFGYTNWRSHEFRAFQEFVSSFGIEYKYIAHTSMQVAVEIL